MLPVLLITARNAQVGIAAGRRLRRDFAPLLDRPRVNPGGYNGKHWTNMAVASLTARQSDQVIIPVTAI